MQEFSFAMQHPNYRSKKLPVALLHFTAAFLLLSAFMESGQAGYPRWIAYIFMTLGVFELVYTFFAARLQRRSPVVGEITRIVTALAFVLYAILLFSHKQALFGICMILIALAFFMIFFIERRWNRPFMLRVNKEGVWFPRFFKNQLFPWKAFNHIVLRGNVLTLDFANNRVAQLDILTTYNDHQTQAFNDFCQSHTHHTITA